MEKIEHFLLHVKIGLKSIGINFQENQMSFFPWPYRSYNMSKK